MKKKYYGIVEGFFSEPLQPWTLKERLDTLKYIQEYAPNIDTYFYCPKDDPFVTKKWDKPYPKDEQMRLKKFINECDAQDISFFYGLNPALEEEVDWKKIESKVGSKLDRVLAMGCKNICLLFDDVPLAYDVVDGTVPESKGYENFVAAINQIYNRYKSWVDDFWVCMPDYTFKEETALTQACTSLEKNIGIIWSGNEVFSKTITQRDIARVERILFTNVRLIYWSNYPVNDCEQALGTFNLGGFYPIKQNVIDMLSGIMVNPMREAYASLPFYATFSDFVRLGDKYSRKKSWERAVREIGLSDQMINLIQRFSSANIVDAKKSQRFEINTLVNLSKEKVRNIWGNRFKNAVQQVFVDAKLYQIMTDDLLMSKGITQSKFLQWDWFPTKTYIARYYSEIVGIVKRRYDVYKSYSRDEDPFVTFDKSVEQFNKTYVGKGRLSISPSDSNKIRLNVDRIIKLERELFLEVLGRGDVSEIKKVGLLYKRKCINRFS